MLRIAVPNKGSLSEAAGEMLHEAGYRQRKDRELMVIDPDAGVELFYLRPRDIAVYVGSGRLDIGITGRDLLLDSRADAEEILPLGFGKSTFRFAGRPGTGSTLEDLKGRRIATSYPGIVQSHLDRAGVPAEVVKLDGAVEISIQLGVADVIADVVSTGTTLRQAGLELIGSPILESEAVVIKRRDADPAPGTEQFLRRLQGVLVARKYVMMDYDIRAERLQEAVDLTPGLESPTVSPLHSEGWVAVRAMVPRERTQSIMDDLWEIGARAILVTDIRACRI
ncbi:ATP phosphoribosyltransferase [Actinospica sp. MGRD01-02]|uniref:ATP phosphoribosyltransferase n=1 Tax=Actinospica acidithermotolerans TaxID=2828514 RepID=A0A941EBW7_9ACTN|nr:ATP phosphoribosyltransferase [Actinospica acidithermotolerans]MBR7827500.1 ATP phosphoribosyltransferase [Actinospica acidithermotolerans]